MLRKEKNQEWDPYIFIKLTKKTGDQKAKQEKLMWEKICWNFNIELFKNSLQFMIEVHICLKIKGIPR